MSSFEQTMMGRSPRCYIPSFVEIGPPVPEKKIFEALWMTDGRQTIEVHGVSYKLIYADKSCSLFWFCYFHLNLGGKIKSEMVQLQCKAVSRSQLELVQRNIL